MNDKKKPRTISDVRSEIEALEHARDRAISVAQAAQVKTDRDARIRATAAVGKIAREYTDPASDEARKMRDAAHTRAKGVHDAAVAAAHGAYEKSRREADVVYEVARKSIDETASAQIRPHEEVLKNTQMDAASARDAEVAEAKREFAQKMAPLLDEITAFEKAAKAVESEVSYPTKEEIKKAKKKSKGAKSEASA